MASRPALHRLPDGPVANSFQMTLHPGDVAVGHRGDRFDTLLGSCVAVVLTDPRRTVGAMCHIVHTTAAGHGPRDASWGDVALGLMYSRLMEVGVLPQHCVALVYGGGNMFPQVATGPGHVGATNANWVLQALAADGIAVVHQDLGGNRYRRLSWVVGEAPPEVCAVDV